MTQNSQHLPIGYRIGGHYEIIKILGQGGFGIVYKVKDTHQLDKILIIKELFIQSHSFRKVNETTIYSKADAKELIEKIKKDVVEEVNILSKIQNRNIVQAYGYFEDNNTIYSVMEYIYGVDLIEYITSNSFNEESVKKSCFFSL
jgi:serine/threonine protein kinase